MKSTAFCTMCAFTSVKAFNFDTHALSACEQTWTVMHAKCTRWGTCYIFVPADALTEVMHV